MPLWILTIFFGLFGLFGFHPADTSGQVPIATTVAGSVQPADTSGQVPIK